MPSKPKVPYSPYTLSPDSSPRPPATSVRDSSSSVFQVEPGLFKAFKTRATRFSVVHVVDNEACLVWLSPLTVWFPRNVTIPAPIPCIHKYMASDAAVVFGLLDQKFYALGARGEKSLAPSFEAAEQSLHKWGYEPALGHTFIPVQGVV